MRRSLAATSCLILVILAAACSSESEPSEPAPPEIDECEGVGGVELVITPARTRVGGAVTLQASGGTGRYTYALANAGSGGQLRGARLIAGTTPGLDSVTVKDDCENSASATLEVAPAFAVSPERAAIRPGMGFKIRVDGALGKTRFSGQSLGSGGSVNDQGGYTAGTQAGLDLIAVRDLGTGEEALVEVRVDPAAQLRAAPERLALPAGASAPLVTLDGSGIIDWQKQAGPGEVALGVFRAESSARGLAELIGTDTFTGETVMIEVQILEELTRNAKPHGRLSDVANVVTGDFDGDGIADVALGVPESDLGKPRGGAVFVFKGAPEGLPSEPSWVLTGESDTAGLGTVIAAGDLDGDGRDDLAVSEPGADVTVADSGAVLLYKFGSAGPTLLRAPLTGLGRGNFGASLAIADVDGDGDADLIVGSPGADLAPTSNIKERGVVDIFLLQRGQAIPDLGSLRIGGNDLAADGSWKAGSGMRFGRAVAVADWNQDGRADLASLGSVNNSLLAGMALPKNQIAIALYFGRDATPPFAERPDLYVLPGNPMDGSEGTWRMAVAPAAESGGAPRLLLSADKLDSPDLTAAGGGKGGSDAGGVYLFDLVGQTPADSAPQLPVQLGPRDALARVWGETGGMSAGRSVALVDIDGDGALELVLGAPNASASQRQGDKDVPVPLAGKLLVYPYAALTPGAQLNKPADVRTGSDAIDSLGVAVAAWGPGGAKGVVAYAARASTSKGTFTGRLDAYLGSGKLASFARSSAEIPARVASQQHGAAVAIGVIEGRVQALVGMPGYSGPGARNDGDEIGAGQALRYTLGKGSEPSVVHEGAAGAYNDAGQAAYGGRSVGSDVALTDWNGDGRLDLVVAAPQLSTPTKSNTDYALSIPACLTSSGQSNGGALIQLAQPDGAFKPAFRVFAVADIPDCMPAGDTKCKRKELAKSGLAGGFDFDGDGKQDLLLTRANGLEIFLGRDPDDAALAKPSMACDPAFSLPALAQAVSAPAALGDLDGDGCDEVAVRYSDSTRSGALIAFGFAAAGGRCRGHTAPAWLRISGDGEKGLNNMQLGVASARAGKLLGDAREFIAISAAIYPLEGQTQPSVLLFDAKQLAAKRPASGEAVVGALNDSLEPLAVAYRERAPGFGRALAGDIDLDGDGVVDLIVSAPGASINGDGTGAVFAFRGGRDFGGRLDPWLTVLGDGAERASVGVDLAATAATSSTPATLAIGAPLSYRTGTANGTAWLLPIER
ncbi:MAG TPA: FG-GAP-like repeat-containing protein [Polyangiales bacterium]|nr:FG-GAP-like repeat-containing protein [Polyangiales bacterium]